MMERLKSEVLILEGDNYKGRFRADFNRESYSYSGDTGKRHNYFWTGEGRIAKKDTSELALFLFETDHEGNMGFVETLERALISFKSQTVSWPTRPEVVDSNPINNIVLESMYQRAQQLLYHPSIVIPKIYPLSLEISEMVKKGLVRTTIM